MLYQNQNGKFVDMSAAAGMVSNVLSFGLGVAVSDFNGDARTRPGSLVRR